jgi:hypothetical protein
VIADTRSADLFKTNDATWVFEPDPPPPPDPPPDTPPDVETNEFQTPGLKILKTLPVIAITAGLIAGGFLLSSGGDTNDTTSISDAPPATAVTSPGDTPATEPPETTSGGDEGTTNGKYDGTYEVTFGDDHCSFGNQSVDIPAVMYNVEDSKFPTLVGSDGPVRVNSDGTFSGSGTMAGGGTSTVSGSIDGRNLKGHNVLVPGDGSFVCDQGFSGPRVSAPSGSR